MRGRLSHGDATAEVDNVIENRNFVVENDEDCADASYFDFKKRLIDHDVYCHKNKTLNRFNFKRSTMD